MRAHVLDDYFDMLRGLPSFGRLAGDEVTVWADRVENPIVLAERIADADALVLFRERTRVGADLVDQLPKLRLVSQRSGFRISISRRLRGMVSCSARTPSPSRR